jgi:hypothetical protein
MDQKGKKGDFGIALPVKDPENRMYSNLTLTT